LLVFLAVLAFFKSIAPVDDEARLLPRKREATSDPALHVRRSANPASGRAQALCCDLFYEHRLRRDKMIGYDDPQRLFLEACEKEVQCLTKT
jgi:hypothetical protein